MPDELLIDAGEKILGIAVLGPVCIGLVFLAAYLEWRRSKDRERFEARYDALQERLLAKTSEVATLGEEWRKTTESQVETVRSMLDRILAADSTKNRSR